MEEGLLGLLQMPKWGYPNEPKVVQQVKLCQILDIWKTIPWHAKLET